MERRKPVIAQVHGDCLAGGSELATSCNLVYIAEDAQVGYPLVQRMRPPEMQCQSWMVGMRNAMELMLTRDAISGIEAASIGMPQALTERDEALGDYRTKNVKKG